ncbi:DUF5675 family protein [Larkinella soli]|uniref:DUF5675 family protein n=1 Tax=Larkinella soli TaxID=1770527 RepID=UPI000FFBAE6C|nr:DUF5675 family protein [Larkinella soli]
MEITITRKIFSESATISDVMIDGQFCGHMLEDRDRGLYSRMPLFAIQQAKVYGKTAIPTGRYEMAVTFSNRFQKYLPLLMNVPGFEGVRWHPGNYADDTEGCQLPGLGFARNMVTDSRSAFDRWFFRIRSAIKTGKVFVTVERNQEAYSAFLAGQLQQVA